MSKTKKPISTGKDSLWARKKSYALMLAIASASATQVLAQDEASSGEEQSEILEEVIVTGMRQSLKTAQDIKRDSATIVDSITAKELGSFPDKSVAEALQRVAGITVNRFAASSDTAHFSAEPSGVVVRGLNQVRTEFNGRDSFSANSSRGLSWGDVSPELMSGVDTYKNQMAELIEGGIAGTVNMRTRVPFDQDGEMIALTLSGNYGDLSEDITPEASALYSNRWETSGGEIGFLANLAYSKVSTRSQGNQLYRMNRFRGQFEINGDGVIDDDDYAYIPASVFMRDNLYDRTRKGVALAFQWQNLDETVVFTTQYNRSEYDNAWEEYIVQVLPADLSFSQSVFFEVPPGDSNPQPDPDSGDFVFDDQGLFQYGTVVTGVGWWGQTLDDARGYGVNNDTGEPFVYPCYGREDNGWDGSGADCPYPASVRGIDLNTTSRSNNNENMTQDLGMNLKWSITDSIRANFDLQYVDSEVDNYDMEVGYASFAKTTIDMRGGRPALDLLAPPNVNFSQGNWSNPSNYYLKYIMDHLEDSEGDQVSFRTDFEFDIDNGYFESVKVGARYADREQVVGWANYNWANVANTWTSNQAPYFNINNHLPNGSFSGYPWGMYETREFDVPYHDLNVNEFVFPTMSYLQDRELMNSTLSSTALFGNNNAWDPICSNEGGRAGETPGTCFTPAELVDVSEKTTAAYVQLNFGGDSAELFGIPYSGNIGVRWVRTENASSGGVTYPRLGDEYFFTMEPVAGSPGEFERVTDPTRANLGCETGVMVPSDPNDPGSTPVLRAVPNSLGCYLDPDDVAFMNGADHLSTVVETHNHILPSFNFKMDFTDEWVGRIAISKAMSRPDIGNMRNYLGIGSSLPDESDPNDPLWVKDGNGDIVGASVFYSGGAQNPRLAPIVATQADISIEYYFADVGSLTLAGFIKQFDDYIQQGRVYENYTNNGVTRQTDVGRPLNGEGAEIQGFEVSFQRFFDFLPEPFDGLGVQANYTYIDNKGITNSNVNNVSGDSSTITGQAPDTVEVNRLEGLSDEAYNLVGMFEKGKWAARLAYNWRSEYMVTAIDCCVAYPIWNNDEAHLDGSIKYSATDYLDISFQGSNLLNTETYLEQQVSNASAGGLRMPNAWFQNDRRYTLQFRFKF